MHASLPPFPWMRLLPKIRLCQCECGSSIGAGPGVGTGTKEAEERKGKIRSRIDMQ